MKRKFGTGLLLGSMFLYMIFDAQTAFQGAKEGITLCLNSVIPALFPFLFISILLNSTISSGRWLRPIGKLCGIPTGAEGILLLGLLGGYPVGAQCIHQAFQDGRLSKEASHRMLGFCNNAGPAFIFGMIGGLFEERIVPWLLWSIHISTALITGILLPGKASERSSLASTRPCTVFQALQQSIRTMAYICGWVMIFRVIIGFLQRWVLWRLPLHCYVSVAGMLELSNGCLLLREVYQSGLRFILCSGMLGFGGICVAMQTASVMGTHGMGLYFPGKVLQSIMSIGISTIVQQYLFTSDCAVSISLMYQIVLALIVLALLLAIRKIIVAIQERMLYNESNSIRKGSEYAVS